MVTENDLKLTRAAETYFNELARMQDTGGMTEELSAHDPLAHLLNAIGATLVPKVFRVSELADQGARRPDFGLYVKKQARRGRPTERRTPERGVVDRLGGHQVLKKWLSYRERDILGRELRPEEVEYFPDAARRIGAILPATARASLPTA